MSNESPHPRGWPTDRVGGPSLSDWAVVPPSIPLPTPPNTPNPQPAETQREAAHRQEAAPSAETPIEQQARLWEERLTGRVLTAVSVLGTRLNAKLHLAIPTWRAERAERLAEEAKTDVGYFRGRIQELRLQEVQDRADIAMLKVRASDASQNAIFRTWNKTALKLALWGANWKKSSRVSLEGRLGAAESRRDTKLQNAATFEEARHITADRFTALLARKMQPLATRTRLLEERARALNNLRERAGTRRSEFAARQQAVMRDMQTLDLTTPEGMQESERLGEQYARIAGNLARIDGVIKRMGDSIKKCGTHHRRVSRAHRFIAGGSNKINAALEHEGANTTETPQPITTRGAPARRRLFEYARANTQAPRASRAAEQATATTGEAAASDDEHLEAIAESVRGTPREFIRKWNREYPSIQLTVLTDAASDLWLGNSFLDQETTLGAFVEKISTVHATNQEFAEAFDAGTVAAGFSDAESLIEDFIITTF